MKASIPVVTTIALVCLPKVACGWARSALMTLGLAAKYESPRANAENTGAAWLSMCKMQTAMIARDLIGIRGSRRANGNGLSFCERATCNIQRCVTLLMPLALRAGE